MAKKSTGGARTAGARKGGTTRKRASAGKSAGARKTGGSRKAAAARKGGEAAKSAATKNDRSKKRAKKTGAGASAGRKSQAEGRGSQARSTRKSAAKSGKGGGRSTARELASPSSRTGGPRGGSSRKTSGAARRSSTARGNRGAGRPRGAGLSPSTQRALWIESPDQRPDRPGQTLATRSHEVIREWAEERGAKPSTISGTERDGRPGVLRFDFPDFGGGGRLREVEWDEWFSTFDGRNLVFLYQRQTKDGRQSNFFRLDSPDREDG